ncbi:MAG: hypothetical protein EOO59_01385 [Hymenobacter sp.]|nr:MAG: hypothetical protein EOO59_01385 [Hymenobacter sp.]
MKGEALAVHEKTGIQVQVTEGGYTGLLNVARHARKRYFRRQPPGTAPGGAAAPLQIVEVDLARLLADSQAGQLNPANAYQRVCGTPPAALQAGGDRALDGDENWAYFRVGKQEAARHLAAGTKLESAFGPRHLGAGPAGIAALNVHTGALKYVVSVPFQIGHSQPTPWVPGELVFCWETGGKSPQRTWTVRADGSGLRPLYPEAPYEWVTHEAVISPDEVAIAIRGHRQVPASPQAVAAGTPVGGANPGQEAAWAPSGTREKPTGLGIVNWRTREMTIAGQTPSGRGRWHVSGSPDGRWAVGDDFARNSYLIDRHTHEMRLLSSRCRPTG